MCHKKEWHCEHLWKHCMLTSTIDLRFYSPCFTLRIRIEKNDHAKPKILKLI